ncbi:hypothetical protein ACTWPT_24225 [Nonomuraea sp. 3N208]|uniref:hypothetical protein n=1 Tax=Nonomuraea sp. 3N208 TaxID=3457421 RepID=UPI003FD58E22
MVLSALTLTAVPAHATATARLTLYSDTAFSQPTNSITYSSCTPFYGTVPGQRVGSFDNTPPPGCQVVLHSTGGAFVLCIGRAVVPVAFRHVVLYQIRSGTSVPCPVA